MSLELALATEVLSSVMAYFCAAAAASELAMRWGGGCYPAGHPVVNTISTIFL